MSRTQRRFTQDIGNFDGQVFFAVSDFVVAPPGASGGPAVAPVITVTNTTPFTESLVIQPSSATGTIHIPLSGLIYRTGMQDDIQESFGGLQSGAQGFPVSNPITWTTGALAVGSSVSIPVLNSAAFTAGSRITVDILGTPETTTIVSIPDATHILVTQLTLTHLTNAQIGLNVFTTPAGITGTPPFTGITQLTPITSPRPKGIAITSLSLIYQVLGAAATSQSIALYRTVFNNAAAPISTVLIAAGTNGLVSTVAAQPLITTVQVPVPAYQVSPFEELVAVYTPVTPAGSTIALYGMLANISFNYN